ncbi:hypothetical protein [Dokdonella sp.]|uniref:hypothetical protein n=1 Tax=Dokdonella sp. TaxID=2291710 RepID=UPI002F3FF3BE
MQGIDPLRRSAAFSLMIAALVTSGLAAAGTPAGLTITIDDAHDFARYGGYLDYTVTLANTGAADATGVSIANAFPPQLDPAYTTWICLPSGVGAICTDSGSGPLVDAGMEIPVGNSLTWLVHAPVRVDASGDTIDNSVDATWNSATVGATDSDALVIFREGFDAPYGDGT